MTGDLAGPSVVLLVPATAVRGHECDLTTAGPFTVFGWSS